MSGRVGVQGPTLALIAAGLLASILVAPVNRADAIERGVVATPPIEADPELRRREGAPESEPAGRVRRLLAAERWREALDLAVAARARNSHDTQLQAAYGETLLRAGRPAAALEELSPLAESAALDGRGAVSWARLLSAGVDPSSVEEWLERAVVLSPDDPTVWYWAGELAPERSRAIERLERYLEIGTDEPEERRRVVAGALRVLREARRREVNAWEVVARPPTVEVPLIPVRGRGLEGLAVDVRLGEGRRSTRVLLDSGTSGLFVTDRIARKRGLVPLGERPLTGGRAELRSTSGTTPRFVLGDLVYATPLVKTVTHDLDPSGRYQGLLGLQPFAGYRVQLDVPARRLRLERAERTGAVEAEEARYWWFSGQLTVEVQVLGEPALFLLDTGAATSALSTGLVDHFEGLKAGEPVLLRRFGLEARGRWVRGVDLRFLGGELSDARLPTVDLVAGSRIGGVEVAGLLGLDLVGQGRLTLDTVRQRVAFHAAGAGDAR